jgi:hypothetical protein
MNTELTYKLHDYILVDNNGKVHGTAKLTKRESDTMNYAFGLNHVFKRYILKREFTDVESGPILIVPKG